MRPFEGDPTYAARSEIRYGRARELLAAEPPASITPTRLREMLSDHTTVPDALCRHPQGGPDDAKTVFWCVADVTAGRISFGRGNPCDSQTQTFGFADYAAAIA
jgi:hypothetical protein